MKRRFLLAMIALLALGSLAMVALADDEVRTCTANTEDGSGLPECGTRADNECYDGGTMAGKCDNEWLWKAGWEIARFNDGRLNREQVNPEWAFLLPPPVEPVEPGVGVPGDALPVITICRPSVNSIVTVCISSNQTGTATLIATGEVVYLYLFVDSFGQCPDTHQGYTLGLLHVTSILLSNNFSQADLDTLGLRNVGCAYWAI